MAIYQTLTEAIQAVQVEMSDTAMVNDPENYSRLIGTLNWLLSPENGRSIETEMVRTKNSGKYRPVEIRYLPKKGTSNVVTSDALANCNAVGMRRESLQTLNADLFAEDKFTIEENVIREGTLQDIQGRIRRELVAAMRNVRESMNAQLLSALASGFGSNPFHQNGAQGVGAYPNIQLIEADGTVDADNFDIIKNDQEDNMMVGNIGIIGKGLARKYTNRLEVGNVNDGGVDINAVMQQFGLALFKDHDTTAQIGAANRILACYAGLQQFFHYNVFASDQFTLDVQNHIRTTIQDPVFPQIQYDFIFKYDDGCDSGNGIQGAWTGRVLIYFNLWTPPDAAFGEPYGDLGDFTGVVGYTVTQG